MIVTVTTIPNKMIPTRLHERALIAKIIGVPIPPAPTIPKIEAERTASSNRYKVKDRNSGISCGNVAKPGGYNTKNGAGRNGNGATVMNGEAAPYGFARMRGRKPENPCHEAVRQL